MKARLDAFVGHPLGAAIWVLFIWLLGGLVGWVVIHRPYTATDFVTAICMAAAWGLGRWFYRSRHPAVPTPPASARPATTDLPSIIWPPGPELVLTLVGAVLAVLLLGYVVALTLRH